VSGDRQVDPMEGTAVKKVPAVRLAEREDVAQLPDLPEQVRLAMTGVTAAAREGCWR
jgi:hypothetical protein